MPIIAEIFDRQKQRVPAKIWTDPQKVEPAALRQIQNLASLPFVFKHVAAMPDVHLGIGATVGSVIATKGAVIPAAVGVDIGCGMMAVRTRLPADQVLDQARYLRSRIEAAIPVGFKSNADVNRRVSSWLGWKGLKHLTYVDKDLMERARLQLGSLGGGNHFIELCLDEEKNVWVMLHSGSRNVGKTLAERHINSAKGLMRKMLIELPDPDLAHFTEGTKEFDQYIFDLEWCQAYAAQNRLEMMQRILDLLSETFSPGEPCKVDMRVNCHHNYTAREIHFGEKVWLTRKGAVRAGQGELGLIPGSMGARSYVVRGLGNAESFHSCAHGAGRRMSRNEAKRRFTTADLVRQTEGVESRKDAGVLDEIPAAYKNVDEVMNYQTDLVEIVATLKQFVCVKG